MIPLPAQWQPLVDAANEIRERAYAPYSGFQVGVAIRWGDDHTAQGVNVENSSYGLTVCAERHAVAAAVLEGMHRGELHAVAVVADAQSVTPPCGACRQVLGEFATRGTRILLYNLRDGLWEDLPLRELLPRAFTPESLPDSE